MKYPIVKRPIRGVLAKSVVAGSLLVAGTAVAAQSSSASSSAHTAITTIKVAIESNSNMANIEKLTPEFEKLNPELCGNLVFEALRF